MPGTDARCSACNRVSICDGLSWYLVWLGSIACSTLSRSRSKEPGGLDLIVHVGLGRAPLSPSSKKVSVSVIWEDL